MEGASFQVNEVSSWKSIVGNNFGTSGPMSFDSHHATLHEEVRRNFEHVNSVSSAKNEVNENLIPEPLQKSARSSAQNLIHELPQKRARW